MTIGSMTKDEAKRRFVIETDALNRQAQADGPAPDSAARMSVIVAEHERRCAALASAERASQIAKDGPKHVRS